MKNNLKLKKMAIYGIIVGLVLLGICIPLEKTQGIEMGKIFFAILFATGFSLILNGIFFGGMLMRKNKGTYYPTDLKEKCTIEVLEILTSVGGIIISLEGNYDEYILKTHNGLFPDNKEPEVGQKYIWLDSKFTKVFQYEEGHKYNDLAKVN